MLLTLGQMYANARGKNQRSGGSVLYPVGGRQFARQNVRPTNPKTSFQILVRDAFTAAAARFSTLTQAQKENWNDQAVNIPRTDPNGDPYNIGGQGLYVGVNSARGLAGVALDDTPPLGIIIDGPGLSAAPELAIGGATITFPITHATEIVDAIWLIELTQPLATPARQPQEDDYKIATTVPANSFIAESASPQTITLTVSQMRYALAEGDRVGIRVTGYSDEYVKGSSSTFVGTVTQDV